MNLIEYYEGMIKKALLDEYSEQYGPELVGSAVGALGGMGLGYILGGRKGALAGGLGGGYLGYSRGKDFFKEKLERDISPEEFGKLEEPDKKKKFKEYMTSYDHKEQKSRQNLLAASKNMTPGLIEEWMDANDDAPGSEKHTDAPFFSWDAGNKNISNSPKPQIGYINDNGHLKDKALWGQQDEGRLAQLGLQYNILKTLPNTVLSSKKIQADLAKLDRWNQNTEKFPKLESELQYYDPNAVNLYHYNLKLKRPVQVQVPGLENYAPYQAQYQNQLEEYRKQRQLIKDYDDYWKEMYNRAHQTYKGS